MVGQLFVLIAGIACLPMVLRHLDRRAQRFIVVSFVAHILAAEAQYLVVSFFYEGGDMLAYHRIGTIIARHLSLDIGRYGPEAIKLVLGSTDVDFGGMPRGLLFAGTSTGSMMGIGALLSYLLGGSLEASCTLIALLSFLSKVLLFRVMRQYVPKNAELAVLIATLLIPSAVFWTCGLLKESIAMIGLGPAVFGLARLHQRKVFSGGIALVVGLTFLLVSKPYVLSAGAFGLLFAGVTGLFARRGGMKLWQAALALAVALGASVVIGQVFPRYALSNLTEELANLQAIGARLSGGSNYALSVGSDSSVGVQLAMAPIALFTALFRPLIVEARNPLILVTALENTVLLVFFVRAIRPGRGAMAMVLTNPFLSMCAGFTATFGVVVGLATTNLGTLSRYRAPMVPFFVGMLLVVHVLQKAAQQAKRDARPATPRNGRFPAAIPK